MEILKIIPYILYFGLIGWAGNWFCRAVVMLSGVTTSKKDDKGVNQMKAGRYIGLLERLLVSIGIVVKSWEVIAVVVALKTVARYKELDNQITAEYFLIGSLSSIFWAILITVSLILYDQTIGFEVLKSLVSIVK